MSQKLESEIGHWFDKIDDKYCQNVDRYEIADIRETAMYFYNFALKEMKAVINDRYDDNLKAYEKAGEQDGDSLGRICFASAAKEDYDIVAIIEEKQGLKDDNK